MWTVIITSKEWTLGIVSVTLWMAEVTLLYLCTSPASIMCRHKKVYYPFYLEALVPVDRHHICCTTGWWPGLSRKKAFTLNTQLLGNSWLCSIRTYQDLMFYLLLLFVIQLTVLYFLLLSFCHCAYMYLRQNYLKPLLVDILTINIQVLVRPRGQALQMCRFALVHKVSGAQR